MVPTFAQARDEIAKLVKQFRTNRAAYGVSFLPGESGRRLTAFFILGIIALSVTLSFFEEYRAQKNLSYRTGP